MRRIAPALALLLPALAHLPAPAPAQQTPAAAEAAQQPVRVFVDCSSFGCDFDYFRKEIAFVDYVRDRQYADVHVLVTEQTTGGGGSEFTLDFIGQRRSAGRADTLRYVSAQNASQDEVRQGLARTLKLGLVRFVAGTPLADRIRITYDAPVEGAAGAQQTSDPWNHWTFRAGVNGNFNGEKTYRSTSLYGALSANRTTEAWKVRLSLNGSDRETRFDLGSGRTVTNEQQSYSASSLVVRSLGQHLSAGGTASATRSTFLNQDLSLRIAPAVEYSVFPYSESTRKQLTANYSVGASAFDYQEETIFGRTSETRLDQVLRLSFDTRQTWGSTSVGMEAASYLHDFGKRRVSLNGGMDLRLVKGLSMNGYLSAARINDQLYLAKGEATDEEILLRQRQLATSYRYYAFVGMSYTFGTILNNVVNPRFGGIGEGGSSCFCF